MGGLAGLSGLSGLSGEFGGAAGGGGGGGGLTDAAAYYKFEADGGDETGNGNDLTLNGGPAFAAGLLGNAIGIASSGTKYASRASTSDLNIGAVSAWTVSVWFKMTSFPARFNCLVAKGPDSGSQEFRLLWDNTFGRLGFEAFGSSNSYTVAVGDGAWHHAVLTGNGTALTLIVDDGSPQSGGAMSPSSGSGVFGVGGQDGDLYLITGQIDSLGVWHRELSGSEISALYNAGAGSDPF